MRGNDLAMNECPYSNWIILSSSISIGLQHTVCWVFRVKKAFPSAMSPGPVIDASADAVTDQQLPSVEEITQKKKPLPQVAPFPSDSISILYFAPSLISFCDLFFPLRKMMLLLLKTSTIKTKQMTMMMKTMTRMTMTRKTALKVPSFFHLFLISFSRLNTEALFIFGIFN